MDGSLKNICSVNWMCDVALKSLKDLHIMEMEIFLPTKIKILYYEGSFEIYYKIITRTITLMIIMIIIIICIIIVCIINCIIFFDVNFP